MSYHTHGDQPLVLFGIKMPQQLKDKIAQAAAADERTMSDWARLKLRDAANEVIQRHELRSVAETPVTYKMGNGI